MKPALLTGRAMRAKAVRAVLKEIGPAGYVRFLQDLYPGHGNYTEERHEWLDSEPLKDVTRELLEMGKPHPSSRRFTRRARKTK